MKPQILINKIFPLSYFLLIISLLIGPAVSEILIIFLIFFFFSNKYQLNDKYILIIFSLFFFSNIISTSISTYSYMDDNFPLSIIKSIFHLRFLVLFFITLLIFQNKDHREIFKKLLIVCLIFLILDTLLQNYTGQDIFGFKKSEIGRLSGPFKDEYIVGGVIFKFYLMYFCISYNDIININKNSIIFLLISNFSMFTIMLSGERSTMILILILMSISLIFIFLKNIKSFLIFLLTIILFSPIYLKNSNFMYERFNTVVKDLSLTNSDKVGKNIPSENQYNKIVKFNITNYGYYAHFYSAFSIFQDNFLFGVGQNNFRAACKLVSEKPKTKKHTESFGLDKKQKFTDNLCTTHPHHIYLEILSENGLLGMIFFIFIMALTFFRIIISKKFYLLGVLVVVFFPVVPTGSFFNNFNSIFFWIILGLIFVLSINQKLFSVHKSSQLSY